MSKLQPILKKEVINFFVKSENFNDERLMNVVIYYEELMNLFCNMLELQYPLVYRDAEEHKKYNAPFVQIQEDIITQYKIILDYLDVHGKNKNIRIFKRFDAFVNSLIILMLDCSKMTLIGDFPFLPCNNNFESIFNTSMKTYFSKFLRELKDLNIENIKIDDIESHFNIDNSISQISDIKDIEDAKVIEYFNNVLMLLKPYTIKRSPDMQELKQYYPFLKSKGTLVGAIRELVQKSKTDLYPSGMYFELKERKDVRNIFNNNSEYKFYVKYLSSWKHSLNPLSPLGLWDSMFPPLNNIFDNLVNYLYKDSLKAEPNFLISRMRGK